MTEKKLMIAGAVMAAISMTSAPASADKVKCYGAALAGHNECGNKAGTQSCRGQSAVDCDPGEWLLADSADDCEARKKQCAQEKAKKEGKE